MISLLYQRIVVGSLALRVAEPHLRHTLGERADDDALVEQADHFGHRGISPDLEHGRVEHRRELRICTLPRVLGRFARASGALMRPRTRGSVQMRSLW